MIVHDFEQYSDSWWAIRKGVPTASKADKIITAKTGVLSTQARPYMCHLISEQLGLSMPKIEVDEFASYWMDRGLEIEPEARRFFTFETGLPVAEVGFVTNDDGTAGCSPDSLVLSEDTCLYIAGLEIKCPMAATHIDYFLHGGLPDKYKQQVHWSLAISGLPVWYWLSYHPELDPVIIKVEPDEYTVKVKIAIDKFVETQKSAMLKLDIK